MFCIGISITLSTIYTNSHLAFLWIKECVCRNKRNSHFRPEKRKNINYTNRIQNKNTNRNSYAPKDKLHDDSNNRNTPIAQIKFSRGVLCVSVVFFVCGLCFYIVMWFFDLNQKGIYVCRDDARSLISQMAWWVFEVIKHCASPFMVQHEHANWCVCEIYINKRVQIKWGKPIYNKIDQYTPNTE